MDKKKCTCGLLFCGWCIKAVEVKEDRYSQEAAKSWWDNLKALNIFKKH
jgi:hypothetical protein